MRRSPLRFVCLESRDCPAITIQFDYSFDTTGFFNDPVRRAANDFCAAELAPFMQDNFLDITPSGEDKLSFSFFNSLTKATTTINNPTVPANVVRIYCIGAPLGATTAGTGGPVQVDPTGSPDWERRVLGRGQPGATATPATDFAPAACIVHINSTNQHYFGTALPGPDETNGDYVSLMQHEIIHAIGSAGGEGGVASLNRLIQNGKFVGPSVMAVAGGPVAMSADLSHFVANTTIDGKEATMCVAPGQPLGLARLTRLDTALLRDIGWEGPGDLSTGVLAQTGKGTGGGDGRGGSFAGSFAVGADSGFGIVRMLNANGTQRFSATPFGATFTGGVRVATGDVNGDGVPDLIAGTGPGVPTQIVVLDGIDNRVLLKYAPFEAAFTGGVFVAAGDLNGDGRADIVISPDQGGGPRVQILNGDGFGVIADFFGIDDPNFRGGARASIGDLNNDDRNDLIVAAGFGGGPRVAGFDGMSLLRADRRKVFGDFLAFEQGLRNGIFVSAGDLDGDGFAELIAGGGPGGAPRVSAFDGKQLVNGSNQNRTVDFFDGDTNSRGGVRVTTKDLDGDGQADVITGAGSKAGNRVASYLATTIRNGSPPPVGLNIEGIPGTANGVFVG